MFYNLNDNLTLSLIIETSFLLFISFIVGFLIEKFRTKKLKTKTNRFNIIISPVVMLGLCFYYYFYSYDVLSILKAFFLFTILFHSSICDIKTREVDDYISIMILFISLINININQLPFMLIGMICVGLPQIIMAMFSKSVPIGGADIKISSACGFMLGAYKGIIALIIGLILSIVCNLIIGKIKKEKNISFPFIPYLSIGIFGAFFL